MAAQVDSAEVSRFQSWTFEKAMLEAQQQSPSDSTTSEFFESGKVRIKPDMDGFKPSIARPKTPVILNEHYLSSEEALSPMDNEDDCSDDELSDSMCDLQVSRPLKFSGCKLAVAIYITSVGKAKVVNVPLPSLTNSPSLSNTSSDSDSQKPFQRSTLDRPRLDEYHLPRRPRTPVKRKAIPSVQTDRPAIRTKFSGISTGVASPTTLPKSSPIAISTPTTRQPKRAITTANITSDSPPRLTPDPFTAPSDSSVKSPQDRRPSAAGHSRLRNISRKISNFALYGPGGRAPDDSATAAPPVPKLHKATPSPTWIANGLAMQSVPALVTASSESNFNLPVTASATASPTAVFGVAPLTTMTTVTVPPLPPMRAPPARPAPRGKMVPRGAAERAPPIEIPPCPDDWEMESPVKEGWVRRRKSLLGFN